MQPNVHVELAHHVALRDRILAEVPDIDEQTLADTLQGACNLDEAIAGVVRSIGDDESLIEGLENRLGEMQERKKRLEARIEKKRALVATAMAEADMKKFVDPAFTVSLVPTQRAVIVFDESQIPPDYMRTPEPPAPRPDKKLIKQAITDGYDVPGCTLTNSSFTVTIRRK